MAATLIAQLQASLDTLPPGALTVAFSGGMDSCVLLHALAQLPAARTRGLDALHIDHDLHADSAEWARQCREFADRLCVPFASIAVTVERDSGSGPEGAARRARLAALTARLAPGAILVLAQHRGDQAETVLLKLLRGAGPEGLGAMRTVRQCGDGYLWRPLLDMPRAALRDYAQLHALRWIEDPSNADTRLRRNFLRKEILPRLARRWPDAETALAHSAAWARAAADFINAQAQCALAQLRGKAPATLLWQGWQALPDALRDPVLRLWLRELGMDEPAHFHVVELERQLRAAHDRTPCVAFAHTELRRYRDTLYALHPLPPFPQDWQIIWDGAPLALPGGGTLTLEGTRPAGTTLTVRYRRGGERIRPAGSVHTRELRLILQAAGIPPWQRARLPLVYADEELIAVGDIHSASAQALGMQVFRRMD
ncbi:MAG: tRNA lysidine(34) synthetase TilS [Rudaea sp.]